ncbi:MAG: polysaccharide biosynthesis C-terminal domain-containing protein [Spirochaetota bacterium]|nr:polysaccharide biosynthesis C-terminal domain-containing protein [Spirochaetota bacterium]
MIKDFINDAIKYIPARIVPGIVGFISIPIITRLFPPKEYGYYSLAITTISIFITVTGWISMSTIRFYPAFERENKVNQFLWNIFWSAIISTFSLTVIFVIFILFIKTYIPLQLYFLLLAGAGFFAVCSIYNVFLSILSAQRKIIWFSGFSVWRSIMSLSLGLLFIFIFKTNIEGLFYGMILSIVIVLPLQWNISIKKFYTTTAQIDLSLIKKMARYSSPLVLGNMAAWILSLSDRYVLEFIRGAHEVGIYATSYNITNRSIMLIISLFMVASSPISNRIWENEGEEKSKEFREQITRYYLMICIPAVFGFIVLAKPLFSIMVGKEYLEGYKIIPFITLGIFFLGLQNIFHAGFLFHKKTGYITFAIGISGAFNLFLNILFIPKFGYVAAALTTLISYVFLLFVIVIRSRRIFVWKFPFRSLVRISLISAIMGVCIYYLSNIYLPRNTLNIIISVLLGIITYGLFLFLFKEIQPEEKENVKNIFYKFFLRLGSDT